MTKSLALGAVLSLVTSFGASAQQKQLDELLAADRAFSAASAKTDAVSGLVAMFSPRVVMPTPSGTFADGIAAVTEAIRANPASAQSKAEWTPVRGGISADGQHGFTAGFMTLRGPDGTETPLKYLAYWVKEDGAWKVAAYKRNRRPPGDVSLAQLPAALPPRMVVPSRDAGVVAAFARSLAEAEQAFSDEAAVIGLGPAFEKFGRADALNMGRGPGFTVGNVAIASEVGGPNPTAPSPLAWKSDHGVLVASSGDLGVSIGYIRDKSDTSRVFPFFTIWRRDAVGDPWRYIAE